MSLKAKFILFVVFIHLLIIFFLFQLKDKPTWIYLLFELLILLTVVIAFRLYKGLFRPLNLITSGIKSIQDKEFNVRFVRTKQKDMDRLIDVYNQMVDQLREERTKQREQHYFLQHLIEASPNGIILLDFDNNVTSINPAALGLLKIDENAVIGKPLHSLEGSLLKDLSTLREGEWKILKPSGILAFRCHKAHFMDRGFRHHFILIEEISEEILKSEKKTYEKVIRLMSHEINNSIGALNSILHSCLNYKNQLSEADREDYESAMKAAVHRSESLQRFVSSIADVVRVPPPLREECDLHGLLREIHTLMSAEAEKRNIGWDWQLHGGAFTVRIDVQQMEQVLVNVIKNAMEAIDEDGSITVITRESPAKTLVIRDDGKGIPAEVQSHIFTPFFSTKKDGKGIGLTLIREILMGHGFGFSLETGEGGFTDFRIEF